MKYLVFSIFFVGLLVAAHANAQERGIGVSPSVIEIGEQVDWPYAVPLSVTNYSADKEQFEVFFENPDGVAVTALPARFLLESGASGRVVITFEEPVESVRGLIKVLSMKTSPTSPSLGGTDGFTTGTGIKIPFSIVKANNTEFLASASEASGGFGYVFGAGLLVASLVLLWYIADIVRVWIPLEVPKKHGYSQRVTEDADKHNF